MNFSIYALSHQLSAFRKLDIWVDNKALGDSKGVILLYLFPVTPFTLPLGRQVYHGIAPFSPMIALRLFMLIAKTVYTFFTFNFQNGAFFRHKQDYGRNVDSFLETYHE